MSQGGGFELLGSYFWLLSALFPLLSQLQSQVALLTCHFELRVSQTKTFPGKKMRGLTQGGVAEPPDEWEPLLVSLCSLLSSLAARDLQVNRTGGEPYRSIHLQVTSCERRE